MENNMKQINKGFAIYECCLNHHKFRVVKADDGEWHLYLKLKSKHDEEHFVNNYTRLKDVKWEFSKNLSQLQVYMDIIKDHLIMQGHKEDFYDFKVVKNGEAKC